MRRSRLSLTGFSQDYRDLIQYTFSPLAQGDPNYFNVAKARSRGLEVEAGGGPVQLTASYAWLDTEVEDAGFDEGAGATFVEGEPLLRRPRHAAGATAFVRVAEAVGLQLSARRTGERSDRDFSTYPATPVTLAAYTVVDLSAEAGIAGGRGGRPGFALTVRGENLLGAEYQEVWGFAAEVAPMCGSVPPTARPTRSSSPRCSGSPSASPSTKGRSLKRTRKRWTSDLLPSPSHLCGS